MSGTRLHATLFAAAALLLAAAPPIAWAESTATSPDETATMALPSPETVPTVAADLDAASEPDAPSDVMPADTSITGALDQDWTMTLADPAAGAAPGAEAVKGAEPAKGGKPAPAKRGPPLPPFTIEGNGGGMIVPMSCLVNRGPEGTIIGTPTAGYTFVKLRHKSVQNVAITETFLRRIEIGYALNVLDLGNFPRAVEKATGIDIDFSHVVMHNFNLRGLFIEEGKYNPSLTGTVTFKYNPTVQHIDEKLFGGVERLGMDRSNGTDYVLTTGKTFIDPWLKRPLIVNGGVRFSQGAQLGLLGFSDTYRMTGEGNVCYLVTDWLAVAYEYRQKKNPYHRLGNLVGKEDAWQTVLLGFVLSDRMMFSCGWGHFGDVVNDHEDGVWGFQFKYEF